MIRLRTASTSYKTTIESIKTLLTSVMPSWSISTKTNSELFKDVYATVNEIEKFNEFSKSYPTNFKIGSLFEPYIIYQYDFTDKAASDVTFNIKEHYSNNVSKSFHDFISQKPSSYSVVGTLKNMISSDKLLYISSQLDETNQDKFIVSAVYPNEVQTFYLDFNHTLISTFTRSFQDDNPSYTYSSSEGKHHLISTDFKMGFTLVSGKGKIKWLTSTNYIATIDMDGDGFIDSSDIEAFALKNLLNPDDLMLHENSVKNSGYYIYEIEEDCVISVVKYTFINRGTDDYVDTEYGDSILAYKLESGIKIELDKDGCLWYGDININNEILLDKVTGFDIYGSGLVFSMNNCIYDLPFDTLKSNLLYTHSDNIISLSFLSSDYIIISDEKMQHSILEPEYTDILIEENIVYSLKKIDSNFLSIKLMTLLDEISAHFGINRNKYESLYDYKNRIIKILGTRNNRSFIQMLNTYYSNIYVENEILYSEYIYKSIGNNPSLFIISIDGVQYTLDYSDGKLYYKGLLVGRYANKYICIYREIMDPVELVIANKVYNIIITIDYKTACSFSTIVVYRPKPLHDDGEITNIPSENINTSEVLIDEYSKNIYESNSTWGNIKWGASQYDMIDDDTYAASQKTDVENTGTKTTRLGIYDYKSFGMPKVSLVEHEPESSISIIVDGEIEIDDFDKKTIQEMTVNGGSVSSKLVINSGKFIDLENGVRVSKIISNFSVAPDNPINTYYFVEPEYPDDLVIKVDGTATPDFIRENMLSSVPTSDVLYDNTGSIIKYIDYDLLSGGKVYLNLYDPDKCDYNLKLSNTQVNIFSGSELTPDPKKFSLITNDDKKTYTGISFPLLNDYYFSSYVPSLKYGFQTSSDKFDLFSPLVTVQSETLVSEFKNSNGSRNPQINITDDQILLCESGLIDTRIDGVLFNSNNINAWKNNTLEELYKKNIKISEFIVEYNNPFSKSPERNTIINSIQSQLGSVLNSRCVIIDVLLFSKEHFYWEGEGNPMPYHTEKMFFDSIKKEINTFITTNNLLLTTSKASLELSGMQYFRDKHEYVALIITIDKPKIERFL